MACEKHGMTNGVFCKYCDLEQLEAEEHRMELEREEREAQERAEMERHFREHPHG